MMENGKPRKRRQLAPEWEVFLDHFAGALSSGGGAEVRRRRERDHSAQSVGEGRGACGVRVGEAGSASFRGAGGGGVVAPRSGSRLARPVVRESQRVVVAALQSRWIEQTSASSARRSTLT